MAKISQKFKAPQTKKQIFASRDEAMQALLNGKTVYEAAVEFDLDEANLDIVLGQNEVFSLLLVKDDGTEIIIPMSSKLIAKFEADGLDADDILKLQFRVTDAPVWKADKDGKKIKTEEKAPFLNVGLPGGHFDYERNNVMTEVKEQELEGRTEG